VQIWLEMSRNGVQIGLIKWNTRIMLKAKTTHWD